MLRHIYTSIFILSYSLLFSQSQFHEQREPKQDSIKGKEFVQYLGNGYLPTKYFNFDS